MFNIGTPEIILIFLIAFVVFGPKQLPKIGRALGRLIGEWRKVSGEIQKTIRDETAQLEDTLKDAAAIKNAGILKDPVQNPDGPKKQPPA